MLMDHMTRSEEKLLSEFKYSNTADHPSVKGSVREIFVRDFLKNHLAENIAIGQGEIISSQMVKAEQNQRQFDVVLYKASYPKIHLASDISAFLVESVIGTIEVKSSVDKAAIKQAMTAAQYVKSMPRSVSRTVTTGYIRLSILSYIVAYDGPSSMDTVYRWIKEISEELMINYPDLSGSDRVSAASPSLDAVIILGKGFIYFDNSPSTFITPEKRKRNPGCKWVIIDSPGSGLFWLFLMFLESVSNFQAEWLNFGPYISRFHVADEKIKFKE